MENHHSDLHFLLKDDSFQRKMLLGWLLFILQVCHLQSEETQPPHIIFIYADDLGWNDVSFHGSPEIPTPNIDALAMSGVTLNNYYGEPLCTPSRGAFLTGMYPIRLGLQHFAIISGEPSALPLNFITLPQHLKKLGYDTHMVGKWHLGYKTKKHMPTNRGFDTFFGYLNGGIGYYDYTNYDQTRIPNKPHFFGIDLYNGTQPQKHFRGKYAPYVFADQAKNIIQNHDVSKPLFLYVAQLAVHIGNYFLPHEAPPEIVSRFKYIKDVDRRIHAGVMTTLDETVGTIFEALQQKDMLKNSIVLFASDNGGHTNVNGLGAGSNYPLRGNKNTFWEGSLHLPAIVWSPLLKLDKPRVSKQLMHATDWLPTFYSAAGGNIDDLGHIDGVDMWKAIVDDLPSPRTHLLNNLDQVYGTSAFRIGDHKVVNGTTGENYDSWYGPSGCEYGRPRSMYQWVFKRGSPVRDILQSNNWWIVKDPDAELYDRATITCVKPPPPSSTPCRPNVKPCLFNVTADPCEYTDLADKYPEAVNTMMSIIHAYDRESMKPQSQPSDPRADPMCHGFTYVPWLDPEHYNACDYAG